jgi:hypothetical protein
MLVLTTVTVSVLAAAALTLALLPPPTPPLRVAAEPPPPMIAPADPTAPSTIAPAPPAPTRKPTLVGRAHAVNNRVSRPTAKPPEPSRPSRQQPPAPRLRQLHALPAFQERFFRSIPGGRQTTVEFVNARSSTVVVHWLDFRGDRVRYDVLSPGETYRQRTFFGHPWLVSTTGGRALAVFLPADGLARATVR